METVANNTSIQSAQENGPHDNYEELNGAGQNLESSDGNSNLTAAGFIGNGLHPNLARENHEDILDVTNTAETTQEPNLTEMVQNGIRISPMQNGVAPIPHSLSANGPTGSRPNSLQEDQPPKLEISTVGSPIVFGANGHGNGSPHAEDERVIERCDVLQHPVPTSVWQQVDPQLTKQDLVPDVVDAPSTSISTPTQMSIPPVSLPVPAPSIPNSPSLVTAFSSTIFDFVRNAPPQISSNPDQFAQAMCQWQWYTIDGVQLPIVLRDGAQLIAVQIAHMKLLSKFPAQIPPEIQKRHVMVSIKVTPTEAWILNIVNATVSNFELGCYVFTTNDDMVDVMAVEKYYWVVKKYHLQNLRTFYESEIHNVKQDNWTLRAALIALRGAVENSIEKADAESKKIEAETSAMTKAETPTAAMQRRMSQTVSH
uniref:Uncharacterized protein n=1 Tax=Acrobeloides nanus TaxID=290746 RepID=A0A914DJ28_9BILA